jgi:hypothetical protein
MSTHTADVESVKAAIELDITAGDLPADVATWAALHDHCDANMLLADNVDQHAGEGWDAYLVRLHRVMDDVNVWLRAGRPA